MAITLPGATFSGPQARLQCAAGYVLYGPQTTLVLTTGETVDLFTLERESRTFRLTRPGLRVPADAADFAINSSNYRHWEEAGPHLRGRLPRRDERPLPSRLQHALAWRTGRGGPPDPPARPDLSLSRRYPGGPPGRSAPARLRGRAHGFAGRARRRAACDGRRRILDIPATSLHQHVPLILGSRAMVEPIQSRHLRPGLWPETNAPLFARRGLFRS